MTKENAEDTLILMLAYLCVAKESEASLERKVQILDRFGLSDSKIAKVCAVTVGSVRNARVSAKKRRHR